MNKNLRVQEVDSESAELIILSFEQFPEAVNELLRAQFGEYDQHFDINFNHKRESELEGYQIQRDTNPDILSFSLKSVQSEGIFSGALYDTKSLFDLNSGLFPSSEMDFYKVQANTIDTEYSIDYTTIMKKLLAVEAKQSNTINYLVHKFCKRYPEELDKAKQLIALFNKKNLVFNEFEQKTLFTFFYLGLRYLNGEEGFNPTLFWKLKIKKVRKKVDAAAFAISGNLRINNVFIEAEFRGKGIIKSIFEFGLTKRQFTWTSTKHPAVKATLLKLGYKLIGRTYPYDFNHSGQPQINQDYILKNEEIFIYDNSGVPALGNQKLKDIIVNNSDKHTDLTYNTIKEMYPGCASTIYDGVIEKISDIKPFDFIVFDAGPDNLPDGGFDHPRYKNIKNIIYANDNYNFCKKRVDLRTGNIKRVPTGIFQLNGIFYTYEHDKENSFISENPAEYIKEYDYKLVQMNTQITIKTKEPNFDNFIEKIKENISFGTRNVYFELPIEIGMNSSISDAEDRNAFLKFATDTKLLFGFEAFRKNWNFSGVGEYYLESYENQVLNFKHREDNARVRVLKDMELHHYFWDGFRPQEEKESIFSTGN